MYLVSIVEWLVNADYLKIKKMKIIVTGGTGFLGGEIVNLLAENSHELICLTRRINKSRIFSENVEFVETDVTERESSAKLKRISEADIFIHSAGLAHQFGNVSENDFRRVNVEGTENAVKLAANAGCHRFLLVSSVAVYGRRENIDSVALDENAVCRPQGFYAESKYEAENVCRRLCLEKKIPLIVVRPATIIGEADRGNVLRLIRLIEKGYFVWIGKGENLKSLIYKKDAAAAIALLAENSRADYEVFNLSGETLRMNEIVGTIAAKLGKKVGRFSVSESLLEKLFRLNANYLSFGRIAKLEETVRKWLSNEVFDAGAIYEKYGFRAATPAVRALELETDWYLKQKSV